MVEKTKKDVKRKRKNFFKNFKNVSIILGVLSIVLIIALVLVLAVGNNNAPDNAKIDLNSPVILKSMDFVNSVLLQGKAVAELKNVSEVYDLYLLEVSVPGQDANLYITKDGKMMFLKPMKLYRTLKLLKK